MPSMLKTSLRGITHHPSQRSRGWIGALLVMAAVAVPGFAAGQSGQGSAVTSLQALPIFPGAVGYGRLTVAGRGTSYRPATVYRITSCQFEGETDASGNVAEIGLKQCLDGDPNRPPEEDDSTTQANFDPRVCVFEVACYIDLPGNVVIDKPYLTIAGQTAPSPGITLRHGKLDIQTHDVLVQHIAARAGFNDSVPPWSSFAIGAQSKGLTWQSERVHDLYFDHVSASFGRDANWSFHAQMDSPSGTDFGDLYARRMTIANSISSEALAFSGHVDANPPECWPCQPGIDPGCHENWEECDGGEDGFDPSLCSWHDDRCAFREPTIHSMAMRISAPFRDVSLVGNLFASNHARGPKLQGSHQSINNLIYNWGSKSFDLDAKILDLTASVVADLIGNVILDGPDSAPTPPVHLRRQIVEGEVEVFFEDNAQGGFEDGNWIEPSLPGDPYDPDFLRYNPTDLPDGYPVPKLESLKQPEPIHPHGANGIVPRHWSEVVDQVREHAGSRPYDLLASGERADAIDRRVLARLDAHGTASEFVDCVGPDDVTSQIPATFTLDCKRNAGGWPPIPEAQHSLSLPSNPQSDDDGDGYTNLEEWLHKAACRVSCAAGDLCTICVGM